MKENKLLNQILEGVQDISRRVTALEVSRPATPVQPTHWLQETYPNGFVDAQTFLSQLAPGEHHPEVLCGMVIGDAPKDTNVIHPIVPMMFHDGDLGYLSGMDGRRAHFSALRDDLPVFLGGIDGAMGMYVPFNCSYHGIEVAKEVLDDMTQSIIEEDIQREIESNGINPFIEIKMPPRM